MLDKALQGATELHKQTAKELIYSSKKQAEIKVLVEDIDPVVGASMFSDLNEDQEDKYETVGPFVCIWRDADSVRVGPNFREVGILRRYADASVVARFWLEDVLVDSTKPYGELFFDRAVSVITDGFEFEVLGYDRYGLGIDNPYILDVALKGTYTAQP